MKKLTAILITIAATTAFAGGRWEHSYYGEEFHERLDRLVKSVEPVEQESDPGLREGDTITIFRDGRYIDMDIESVRTYGGVTEVEVYQWGSGGGYSTFEIRR